MTKYLKIIALLLLLLPLAGWSQDVKIDVRTRTTVSAGQTFQITFDVNARAQDFRLPSMKGLTIVSGPSTSMSSSTSFINGKVTSSVSNAFTILVRAEEEGTASVGSASCIVDGKSVSSKPFTIKVEKADPNRQQQQQQANSGWPWGSSQQNRQQQQQQQKQQKQTTIDNNTLFARAWINKNNLYQGEEAIIVYKIYTQVPLTQFQIDKLPRNKGFWSEDLSENMSQVKQYSETYNGRQYQVAEIRRGALYPQETGTLNIAPLKTDVVAIIQTQMQHTGTIFDFFIDDPFFTPTRQQAVVRSLTSNSINVNVKPLPDPPYGFAGGVGHFEIKAKTDLKELHANEAFTYSVTVSGRGNLSLLEAPQINFPQGMEVYEPRVIDNINKGDNGLSGSRTFEWIITPQAQGEYDLPAFEYVYFDPSKAQYVTIHGNKIHIKVSKPLHTASSKTDVKELNSDIHHIRKDSNLRQNYSKSLPSVIFWILVLLPCLISGVVILIERRRQDIAGDEASMKLQRATKLARKRLRNAEKHLHDGNDELFYEEIYKALWGGIADKFNIQQSLLSSDTIRQHLEEKNVDSNLQQRILQTLADVDFARFAPGDSSTKKQSIYDETMNTIMQIGAIKINLGNKKSNPMNKTSLTVLIALLCLTGTTLSASNSRDEAHSIFLKANAAYDSGNYQKAADLYTSLSEEGWQSWELYYNLGNAYYRLDETALSVLNYERALRLAPNKKIIKENLALANSKTADKIDELPRLFLLDWIDAVVDMATARTWLTLVVFFVMLLSASFCIFFIAKDYRIRKIQFIGGSVLIFLLVFSAFNATLSVKNVTNNNKAIVMKPLLVVKGSPDAKSVDKFVLHEGTKLTITDRQDQWWQVEIADGKNGWIADGAEII